MHCDNAHNHTVHEDLVHIPNIMWLTLLGSCDINVQGCHITSGVLGMGVFLILDSLFFFPLGTQCLIDVLWTPSGGLTVPRMSPGGLQDDVCQRGYTYSYMHGGIHEPGHYKSRNWIRHGETAIP